MYGLEYQDLNLVDVGLGLDSKIHSDIFEIIKNILEGQTNQNHRREGLRILGYLSEPDEHWDNIIPHDFEVFQERLEFLTNIGFVLQNFLLLNIKFLIGQALFAFEDILDQLVAITCLILRSTATHSSVFKFEIIK